MIISNKRNMLQSSEKSSYVIIYHTCAAPHLITCESRGRVPRGPASNGVAVQRVSRCSKTRRSRSLTEGPAGTKERTGGKTVARTKKRGVREKKEGKHSTWEVQR